MAKKQLTVIDAARLFADAATAEPGERVRFGDAHMGYNAEHMARLYPQTSADAWLAYYVGGYQEAARPVPFGTPITRQQVARTRAVTYAGVLVVETATGWQATDVISYIQEAA